MPKVNNWYFVSKIVLTSVRKQYSSERENRLKFEAEGQEFIRRVKGQNNF